ncbi:hypothetical protein Vau01_008230 [Virgisporangium aurantiacum]|uniref:Uncharacterized protein n=1 Tax=Virgisporangium aurantiacum TaxID=175570 RepID=A0A8J4DYR2_9ACTN|nr:hypothetical protein Vau01_008230 [Virgisporangium aurantiacum]
MSDTPETSISGRHTASGSETALIIDLRPSSPTGEPSQIAPDGGQTTSRNASNLAKGAGAVKIRQGHLSGFGAVKACLLLSVVV